MVVTSLFGAIQELFIWPWMLSATFFFLSQHCAKQFVRIIVYHMPLKTIVHTLAPNLMYFHRLKHKTDFINPSRRTRQGSGLAQRHSSNGCNKKQI